MIDFYERTNKKPYVLTFGRVKCIYPISQIFDLSIFEKIEYSAEKIEEFANINDFVCWCNPFARSIKTVWVKDKCVMYLGCLHRCPKFAIQYGKKTKKHGQYTNPNVKL